MSVFKKYISNDEDKKQVPMQPDNTQSHRPEVISNQPSIPAQQAPPQSQQVAAPPAAKPAPTNGRNVLSSDVEIKGKVKFANDLVVDGIIEGEIISDGSLTVGENARIKAEIQTRSVVIYGKVHGNINVTDRVDLRANAELVGDIKAGTLSIEAGAIFVGKSAVGAPSAQPAAKSTSNKSNNNNNNKQQQSKKNLKAS